MLLCLPAIVSAATQGLTDTTYSNDSCQKLLLFSQTRAKSYLGVFQIMQRDMLAIHPNHLAGKASRLLALCVCGWEEQELV